MGAGTSPVADTGVDHRDGFDHRDAGTPESHWAESGLVQGLRSIDLSGVRRLVVIAAHPDDETLGAGGLIATAAATGVAVTVIVATSGEASHPDSPSTTAADLAVIRRAEARTAIGRLAPQARLVLLDLGDGRLGAAVDQLADEIRSLLEDSERGQTWLVAPWQEDRHPDHEAASQAAGRVARSTGCRLLEYPVWTWHWARPGDGTLDPATLVAFDVPASSAVLKQWALADYRSQTEPLSPAPGDEPVVPPGFGEHFIRQREVFVDVENSLDEAFFDEFYADTADPWGFRTRWYETRKRAITLASLPRERFGSAFEPGCAIGVLTAELAPRCDHLLATDISQLPLIEAGQRLAGFAGVTLEQRRVPQDWPPGLFDLVVLSEIGYYCGPADLSLLIESASSSLTSDGVLLACHWRHPVADYPLGGDEVHRRLRRESGLEVLASHVEEDFLLDVLVRSPARSVARRDGLL